MHDIILGIVSGGALAAVITSVTAIIQSRKGKQDSILAALAEIRAEQKKIRQEQDKAERDALRTQLLVLLAYYPSDHSEILTAAERYFAVLHGDWFLTPLFNKFLIEQNIGKPEWFDPNK